MIRRGPLQAKVIGCGNQPTTEKCGPVAIDHNTRREWVLWQTQPASKSQSVSGQIGGPGMQNFRRSAGHFFFRLQVFPAMVPMRGPRVFRRSLLHDQTGRNCRAFLQGPDRANFFGQLRSIQQELISQHKLLLRRNAVFRQKQQLLDLRRVIARLHVGFGSRGGKTKPSQRTGKVPAKRHGDRNLLPGGNRFLKSKHGDVTFALSIVNRPPGLNITINRQLRVCRIVSESVFGIGFGSRGKSELLTAG